MTQSLVPTLATLKPQLEQLAQQLEGELHFDTVMRTLYATDASAYREMPLAVAIPKSIADIKTLIEFARTYKTSLIPRTAGTSLAGQVVGNGIVVDVSRTFTSILEVNVEEHWVRVQPGVVRDELNLFLKPYSLYFGPETSTANRAMIGGMVGNNSCGSNSVVYGSTREHLLEVKAILADGSEAEFSNTTFPSGDLGASGLLGDIYNKTFALLSDSTNQAEIRKEFPKTSIERRNTGYALDMLLDCEPFTAGGPAFNMCRLIAGSEGTLCFLTEIKLNVSPLPPSETGLVCIHFNSIDESLRANIVAMQYKPSASELMDHYVLECTKANAEQRQNRFFVAGDPAAILVVEFRRETQAEIDEIAQRLIAELKELGLGYHFPMVYGDDSKKVWNLRKAGLGLLSNLPGDEKAVAVIEDTAVDVKDLPAYIREFNEILTKHQMYSVHYAHAGSGELHLRPIINLKTAEGHQQFRTIATEIAHLVKKYKGSLSGEHGDGRLRGEFIRLMVGEHNYGLMKEIKRTWDPDNIFNPGKVVDTPPMDTFLRYEADHKTPEFKTHFRFHNQNVLQHAEQCNGSGDCRKTHLSGGTMCPSYMATRNEKDTTRARANILREYLTNSQNPLNSKAPAGGVGADDVKEVMDLCLACKGCKAECPSNVDVAKLKMEFLQNYYETNGVPMRSWLVGNFSKLTKIASYVPWAYNFIFENAPLRRIANQVVGFHPDRTMPLVASTTLKNWIESREKSRVVKSSQEESREVDGSQEKSREVEGSQEKSREVEGSQEKSSVKSSTIPTNLTSSTLPTSTIPTNLTSSTLPTATSSTKVVYLFIDEFTNYNDVEIGKKAVQLLEKLGYEVLVPEHVESGRPQLSKGLLKDAKKIAEKNVRLLKNVITAESPLIGIEPSAILTFRDEYPDLVPDELVEDAKRLGGNALMIDEFIAREIDAKRIKKAQFTQEKRLVKLHGHCQQKAVASVVPTKKMLSLPQNYEVQLIPSGCCGMAGSFGYEKEHFELSNKIGELVLFPTVRKQAEEVIIAAPGTSCRHQIHDGTGRTALHPVEILWDALL